MEKPGIDYVRKTFCGRVPWLYQYWPGGSMLFVVLCPGTPEGSTGSGSGFKASQKTGQRLKVSSDRLGEAGNRTCDPWFTRHSAYPLHHGGFSYYVRNLLTVWTVQSSNNNVHTYNSSLLKLGPIASLTLKNELGTPIKLSCVSFGTRNNL